MKKTTISFSFLLLVASLGIAQTSAQTIKLERLTASGCGNQYPLKDSQDLKKVFGPKWKLLFRVNPDLENRISSGSVLQKLFHDDTLCVPIGLKAKEEMKPFDGKNANKQIPEELPLGIRGDQIVSSDVTIPKTAAPAGPPMILDPKPVNSPPHVTTLGAYQNGIRIDSDKTQDDVIKEKNDALEQERRMTFFTYVVLPIASLIFLWLVIVKPWRENAVQSLPDQAVDDDGRGRYIGLDRIEELAPADAFREEQATTSKKEEPIKVYIPFDA